MGEMKVGFTLPDQDHAVILYFRERKIARKPLP